MAEIRGIDANAIYDIKFLNESHLSQILHLQDIIKENLADPATYYAGTHELFSRQLAIDKSVIGIFKMDQLVGFNVALLPGLNEDNFGVDIGLHQEELAQVVQFGPVAVHPEHRNKGLLGKLIEKHLEVIEETEYRHVCLTIAPNNYPSIKRTLTYGFVIKHLKQKYGSLLRYVLHLDLKKPYTKPRYIVKISSIDIESQRFMMQLGFYGYGMSLNNNGIDINFGLQ